MRRKARHWAVIPGVVVATLAALGALGTAIVKSATYLTLPERVEATERKNESQDKQLDRLITLQEYYAQQPQQQPTWTPFRPPHAKAGYPSSDSPPSKEGVLRSTEGLEDGGVLRGTEELSDDGEVKVLVWTDEQGVKRQMCCQGTTCWPWHEQTQCEH